VILLAFKVILFHSSSKDLLTGVTAQCKVLVMAVCAERSLITTCKGSVNQRVATVRAVEASLVPVLVLVRQILEVSSYWLTTRVTAVGKEALIALNTEWLVLSEDITTPRQSIGAVETIQTLPFQHEVLHLGVWAGTTGGLKDGPNRSSVVVNVTFGMPKVTRGKVKVAYDILKVTSTYYLFIEKVASK